MKKVLFNLLYSKRNFVLHNLDIRYLFLYLHLLFILLNVTILLISYLFNILYFKFLFINNIFLELFSSDQMVGILDYLFLFLLNYQYEVLLMDSGLENITVLYSSAGGVPQFTGINNNLPPVDHPSTTINNIPVSSLSHYLRQKLAHFPIGSFVSKEDVLGILFQSKHTQIWELKLYLTDEALMLRPIAEKETIHPLLFIRLHSHYSNHIINNDWARVASYLLSDFDWWDYKLEYCQSSETRLKLIKIADSYFS